MFNERGGNKNSGDKYRESAAAVDDESDIFAVRLSKLNFWRKWAEMDPNVTHFQKMLFYVRSVGRHSMKVGICKVLTTIRRPIICLLLYINISISFRISYWLFCTVSRLWACFLLY